MLEYGVLFCFLNFFVCLIVQFVYVCVCASMCVCVCVCVFVCK